MPVRGHLADVRQRGRGGAVLEHDGRRLVVVHREKPSLRALHHAALQGLLADRAFREQLLELRTRQVVRGRGRRHLRIHEVAVAPFNREGLAAGRRATGHLPRDVRHARPELRALRLRLHRHFGRDVRGSGRAEAETDPDGTEQVQPEIAEPRRAEVAPTAPRARVVDLRHERTERRAVEPRLPVERFRHGRLGERPRVVGRGLSPAVREHPDVAELADESALQERHRLAVARPRGDLRAHLRDGLLLGGEALDLAAVGDVVAEGFLSVDVEPAREGVEDVSRVRVVGRGDVDGVDAVAFLLHHLVRVAVGARVGADLLGLGEVVGVHVAERGDVDVGMAAESVEVAKRHVARADAGMGEHRVRATARDDGREADERGEAGGGRGGGEEGSACGFHG